MEGSVGDLEVEDEIPAALLRPLSPPTNMPR
jgi:hypothetical protein